MIKLHDKYFRPFISATKISAAIDKLVAQIHADHKNEIPVFVGILNGAFMFVSDFVKKYPTNCEITFLKLSSYKGTTSTKNVKRLIGIQHDLKGRSVVILEDIIDTGNTLEEIQDIFLAENVKSLKIATLFFKPEAYKKQIPIDYIGLEIPSKFIVGYGLDYDELGRNLPEVYQLKE